MSSRLASRFRNAFLKTFDLGFTCFGGTPVHFQTFHRRFVEGNGGEPWVTEKTYQELFALVQALPGPSSTKLLFNIVQMHFGFLPAIMVFMLWALPASIGVYGFSLGVSHIGETLPEPVYAMLSGCNAVTVGLIALAAVQLARKAISDGLTRLLVVFGACAGLCYNALWYFPVLLVCAGATTSAWDLLLHPLAIRWRARPEGLPIPATTSPAQTQKEDVESQVTDNEKSVPRLCISTPSSEISITETGSEDGSKASPHLSEVDLPNHRIPLKIGIAVIVLFFSTFAAFMAVRGMLFNTRTANHGSSKPPLFLLDLFTTMLLAGTIIFGGGTVMIPLLRDYVVEPGWVSPRDFLLGLAVIQALPGPTSNFAVYLGALAAGNMSNAPSIAGAILAFLGIFTPGLWLSVGFQSIWYALRERKEVTSILRGVNAAAVGFVFAAVYGLWEIGFLTPADTDGTSLGGQPWWLAVAASTFTAVEWFSVPPPIAILTGGVAGLAWWGVVGRH